MADIDSIIKIIAEQKKNECFDELSAGYWQACDDIINALRLMEDKEPELRRCLKSLVEVTKHLNLCPGVMSECEDILK